MSIDSGKGCIGTPTNLFELRMPRRRKDHMGRKMTETEYMQRAWAEKPSCYLRRLQQCRNQRCLPKIAVLSIAAHQLLMTNKKLVFKVLLWHD